MTVYEAATPSATMGGAFIHNRLFASPDDNSSNNIKPLDYYRHDRANQKAPGQHRQNQNATTTSHRPIITDLFRQSSPTVPRDNTSRDTNNDKLQNCSRQAYR